MTPRRQISSGNRESPPPTLAARRVYGTERSDSLVISCPYCGSEHWHGAIGKTFGSGDGHRVAHCGQGAGYIVAEQASHERVRRAV